MNNEWIKAPRRVRFNWGYHDGAGDTEQGREPAWKDKGHHDPVYVAGYHSGVDAYRRLGERPESSDEAWGIYRHENEAVADWRIQQFAADVVSLSREERIDKAVMFLLGTGPNSLVLDQVLGAAFPEARSLEQMPMSVFHAIDALKEMVADWVDARVPAADDEPEAPHP